MKTGKDPALRPFSVSYMIEILLFSFFQTAKTTFLNKNQSSIPPKLHLHQLTTHPEQNLISLEQHSAVRLQLIRVIWEQTPFGLRDPEAASGLSARL